MELAMHTPARIPILVLVAVVGLAACGGGDDADEQPQAADPAEADDRTDDEADDQGDDQAGADADAGGTDGEPQLEDVLEGTATIAFEGGEVLSTEVLCTLEPQTAAGQEILYTATSLSNPYFDVTVFGEDAAVPGPSVSWNETEDFETYQESWSAMGGSFGDLEVTLDGTTISGQGTFRRDEDAAGAAGETRQATVEVVCG